MGCSSVSMAIMLMAMGMILWTVGVLTVLTIRVTIALLLSPTRAQALSSGEGNVAREPECAAELMTGLRVIEKRTRMILADLLLIARKARPALVLVALLRAPHASGKDSAYMTQAKAVVGFRFRGELAKNEVVLVAESKLPKSLHHIVFGVDGLLYASSFITSEVYSAWMDSESGKLRWFRVVGHGTGVDGPTGMAVDSQQRLLVASFGTDQILRYDTVTGKMMDIFINDDEGHMDCPEGLLLLPDRLLVASFLNDRVLSYHPETGAFQEVFARGHYLDGPQVMLLHPASQSILVSSYHKDQIMVVDSATGKKKRHFGGRELARPVGLAAAPGDEVLVVSHKGNAILRYNVNSGDFVDVFAEGHGLWAPTGLAMSRYVPIYSEYTKFFIFIVIFSFESK